MLLSKTSAVWIVFLSLVFLVHHFCFFYGHFGYDDMHYARLSHNLLNGNWDMSDHYSHRLSVISLTALSYSIFGITDFASGFFPLCMSLAICLMILHALNRYELLIQLIGLSLYFIYQWNLFYSDKLMADIFVSFFMTLAYYIRLQAITGRLNDKSSGILFVLALFCAFFAKGTFVLLLPLFLFVLFSDITNQRLQSFWKCAIVTTAILSAIYLSWNYFMFDNPLIRLEMIERGSYINECSYSYYGLDRIIKRLTTDFTSFLIKERFYIYLVVIAIIVFFHKITQHTRELNRIDLLTVIIVFLSMNFMTISFSDYNPFCLDPRHFMMAIPILAISIGRLASTAVKPLKIGLLSLVILFLYNTVQYSMDSRKLSYPQVRESIQMTLDQIDDLDRTRVFASQVMINLMEYYSHFELGDRIELINIEQIGSIECGEMVIRNWYGEFHSNLSAETYDQIIKGYSDVTAEPTNRLRIYMQHCQ